MASIASLLVPGVSIPTPDTSWIGGAADTIVGGIDKYKQNKSFNKLADLIGQQPGQQAAQMAQPTQTGFLAGLGPRRQPQTMAAPLTAVDRSAPQGDTYEPFISTVKSKITNPYGLAAVAATGRAESGWSSGNANRTWSDPSQSGQPGTAGGVMSWRGPRLEAMQNFAAQKGERLGAISPQTQAEFFLQEDPNLIATLNNARSPEEAADAMAKAWAFAGHDNPGQGEAARRRAMTTNYAAQFRDMPNAGLAAIDAQAAPSGSLSGDPAVTVADPLAYGAGQAPATDPALQSIAGQPLPDQAFDDRFGPTALPAEIVQGADGLAGALESSNRSAPVPTPSDGVTSAVQAPAAVSQPAQVADASGGFAGVPPVTPIQRGQVPVSLIQEMLRDPNLRDIGVKLWAQNVEGPKSNEPWQFVKAADGTLLRANQQTGEVVPIGNYGKDPTGLGADEAGLNLVYGQDANGKTVAFQPLKGGGLKQVSLPDGTILTPGISNIDTGTGTLTVNNKTGVPVRETAKDVAGAKREQGLGAAQADAQTSLPQVEGAATQMLDAINGLETDPYLNSVLGPVNSRLPNISGESERVQSKLDQIGGQAFLQAFNMLRGGGQITEIEGEKATRAMSRLNVAQNPDDFRAALTELKGIVGDALGRAKRKAAAGSTTGPAPDPTTDDPLGIR